jgi:hypothetical protein
VAKPNIGDSCADDCKIDAISTIIAKRHIYTKEEPTGQ